MATKDKKHPSGLDDTARKHILDTVAEFEGRQIREQSLAERLREVYGDEPEPETSEA